MNSKLIIALVALCMLPAAEGMSPVTIKGTTRTFYYMDYYEKDINDKYGQGKKLVTNDQGLSLGETEDLIKSMPCPEEFIAFENNPIGCKYTHCGQATFKALTRFSNLTHLFLNKTQLENFSGIEKLKNLIVLGCKNNKRLISISGLEGLTQLKKLVLSHSPEICSPSYIFYYPQIPSTLEHLEITATKIKRLRGLKHLKNLKILIARNNNILCCFDKDMPHFIKHLDLSFNKIDAISLAQYTQCKTIKLYNNPFLSEIPAGLEDLIVSDKLEEIDLDTNIAPKLLKNFIEQFKKRRCKKYFDHVVVLSLQKLLLNSIESRYTILMEKQYKIDDKLRELEEMRKIWLSDKEENKACFQDVNNKDKIENKDKKLTKKRNKIDAKLLKLEEMRRICLNEDEHK